MTQPAIDQDLEFVGRQLAFLCERESLTFDEAVLTLQQAVSGGEQEAVELIERLRRGEDSTNVVSLGELFRLVRLGAVAEHKLGSMIQAYYRAKRETDQDLANYFLGLRGTFTYGVAVLAVALMVSVVFAIRVLPTIQETFGSFGTEVPKFTAFMLGNGSFVFVSVIALALLAIVSIGVCLLRAYSDFLGFRYSAVSRRWLVVGTRIVPALNDYTLLKYLLVLVKGGSDLESAMRCIAVVAGKAGRGMVPFSNERFISRLETAGKCGTYEQELEYQLGEASGYLIAELSAFRSVFNLGIQILTLVVVGSMVISYYLPIFQMGIMV